MKILKQMVPKSAKAFLIALGIRLRSSLDTKRNVLCNICLKRGENFKPFNGRADALCPSCLSLERHRLLFDYFERKTDIFEGSDSILHFAPEKPLWNIFRRCEGMNYTTADLMVQYIPLICVKPDRVMSVTDIAFPAASFDWVICNHVLEHVLDDSKAMSEIYRVLKPGGRAILMVPIRPTGSETLEDLTLDRNQRRALYGSPDHLRYYGEPDYLLRLKAAGFSVEVIDHASTMPKSLRRKNGVRCSEKIYLAVKADV